MTRITMTLILIACLFFSCQTDKDAATTRGPVIDLKIIGVVSNKTTHQIVSSNWSVGGETMDRDFTSYNNWKDYIEPLGIKRMRIQSGWAKTEKVKGVYDWDWLDEVIYDLKSKAVDPWVCLCYGNPIYEYGGTPLADSPLPSRGEALAAWQDFIRAFVGRYQDYIYEWEIWNEPNLHKKTIKPEEYAEFFMTTAGIINEIQPDSKVLALSMLQPDSLFTRIVMDIIRDSGKLEYVDVVTYHPYAYNPDTGYDKVLELRKLLLGYDTAITIFQGENGAPSERRVTRAIGDYDWNELSQAKWALRRMVADFGHNIPSSYFSIMVMKYPEEINRKGLLYGNEDKTVNHPKKAYFAIQNLTAIFDDNLKPLSDFSFTYDSGRKISAYAFIDEKLNTQVVVAWFSDQIPDSLLTTQRVDFTFCGVNFSSPLLIDLLSGNIYRIENNSEDKYFSGKMSKIPVYDSPVLILEEKLAQAMELIRE